VTAQPRGDVALGVAPIDCPSFPIRPPAAAHGLPAGLGLLRLGHVPLAVVVAARGLRSDGCALSVAVGVRFEVEREVRRPDPVSAPRGRRRRQSGEAATRVLGDQNSRSILFGTALR
jgi:hypothetical protein